MIPDHLPCGDRSDRERLEKEQLTPHWAHPQSPVGCAPSSGVLRVWGAGPGVALQLRDPHVHAGLRAPHLGLGSSMRSSVAAAAPGAARGVQALHWGGPAGRDRRGSHSGWRALWLLLPETAPGLFPTAACQELAPWSPVSELKCHLNRSWCRRQHCVGTTDLWDDGPPLRFPLPSPGPRGRERGCQV